MSFSGKVVIVTGASSGIGAATAVMFCKEGANVTLVASVRTTIASIACTRNENKLKNTAEKCSAAGGKHFIIKAAVSNGKRIITDTVKKFGKLDVLVNNAGKVAYGNILKGTIRETYDKIMNINLRVVVNLTSLAAPHLIKTKGNIINISSIAGRMVVNSNCMVYCISKAGLNHFTSGTALELESVGVRVNAISSGPVATDILEKAGSKPENLEMIKTQLERISQPEEIADLILYLASEKAKSITGSNFVSDNGCLLK